MDAELNIRHLEVLAKQRGLVIVEDSNADNSYALVKPDNAGKGTDPQGVLGGALAFADGMGMSLEDVADILIRRVS